MPRQLRSPRRLRIYAQKCAYCEGKIEPDYKDTVMLSKFVSERGKIIPATRSGLCSAHQRRLTVSVKRARHVALLPFIVRA